MKKTILIIAMAVVSVVAFGQGDYERNFGNVTYREYGNPFDGFFRSVTLVDKTENVTFAAHFEKGSFDIYSVRVDSKIITKGGEYLRESDEELAKFMERKGDFALLIIFDDSPKTYALPLDDKGWSRGGYDIEDEKYNASDLIWLDELLRSHEVMYVSITHLESSDSIVREFSLSKVPKATKMLVKRSK